MLIILNLAPIIFGVVLWRNRANLSKPEIKAKIGSLYELHNSEKQYVGTYSIVFLVRRSFFVMMTFALYHHPGLQIELMLYSTLAYLCYISQMPFYNGPMQRRVEITNECLLVCLCYHFVIFADIVWGPEIVKAVGTSTTVFVCTLLGVNIMIIMWMNVYAIKLRCKRRIARKEGKRLAGLS